MQHQKGLSGHLLLMGRQKGKTTMLVKMYQGQIKDDGSESIFVTPHGGHRAMIAGDMCTGLRTGGVFLPQAFATQASALTGHNLPPLYVYLDEFGYLRPRDEDAVLETLERIARHRQVRVVGATTAPFKGWADSKTNPAEVDRKLVAKGLIDLLSTAESETADSFKWITDRLSSEFGIDGTMKETPKRRIVDHDAFVVLKADTYHEELNRY